MNATLTSSYTAEMVPANVVPQVVTPTFVGLYGIVDFESNFGSNVDRAQVVLDALNKKLKGSARVEYTVSRTGRKAFFTAPAVSFGPGEPDEGWLYEYRLSNIVITGNVKPSVIRRLNRKLNFVTENQGVEFVTAK